VFSVDFLVLSVEGLGFRMRTRGMVPRLSARADLHTPEVDGFENDQTEAEPVQRFRGGLVFKVHRILHHSTLGLRVIKKKKKKR